MKPTHGLGTATNVASVSVVLQATTEREPVLEPLNLSELEEGAYLALLCRPAQTAVEIRAALPGASRATTARTIDALVTKGLASRLAGRPHRFSPIAPDVALEAMSLEQIERVKGVQRLIPTLMDEYWKSQQDVAASDVVEVMLGTQEEVGRHLFQVLSHAQSLVRAFERGPYPPRAEVRMPNPVELSALRAGIEYRVIYDQSELTDLARWPDLRAGLEAGEDARVYDGLPLRMLIIDDWVATTSLWGRNHEYLGSVIVHASPVLDGLQALFESYWSRALPLSLTKDDSPAIPRDDGAPHPAHELVTLLSTGITDESIAKAMGVSRSTVQRRVNELMAELGVRSRFQLGLRLGGEGSPLSPTGSD